MPMKILVTVILTAMLSGCAVLSLHELYTPDVLVTEPTLEGNWLSAQGRETTKIVYAGDKTYRIIPVREHTVDEEGELRVVNIRGHLYFDVTSPEAVKLDEAKEANRGKIVPGHVFVRVRQIRPTLQISYLKADWLTEYLGKKPTAISSVRQDGDLIFTASPKEVQEFLVGLEHVDDAWAPWMELQPAAPAL